MHVAGSTATAYLQAAGRCDGVSEYHPPGVTSALLRPRPPAAATEVQAPEAAQVEHGQGCLEGHLQAEGGGGRSGEARGGAGGAGVDRMDGG